MKKLLLALVLFMGCIGRSMLMAQSYCVFEYDNLDRLVKVTRPSGQIIQYSYDALGNRTSKVSISSNISIVLLASPTAGGTVSGGGVYFIGDNCTVTASANPGYSFTNWMESDSVVSEDISYSFVVSNSRTLVANFSLNSYAIVASANPAVGGTVMGAGEYNHGANVTLSATANAGYTFVNWTENDVEVSTSPTYSFTATAGRNLVANFTMSNYTVSASANPAVGGTVTGAGEYNHGANVTLSASAHAGYTFVNWTENDVEVSTSPTYSFTATASRTLVANFTMNSYTVSASANPAVGGTATGAGEYNHGANVTLSASAHAGYTFVNWTENDVEVSTSPTYSFTATANRTLVANFALNTYTVSVSANPAVGGTVTGAGEYNHGANVTLSATANAGYTFVNWTENGTQVSTSAVYSFTAITDRILVANFTVPSEDYYWTPVTGLQNNMTVNGIVRIDGVEQFSSTLEIGAFYGNECRGRERAAFFPPTSQYLVSMTIGGSTNGEAITFRIYDHAVNQELELASLTPAATSFRSSSRSFSSSSMMGYRCSICII